MLHFKKTELSDKAEIEHFLQQENSRLLNYNFQILYLYRDIYHYQYAVYKDFLIIKTFFNNRNMLFFPVGSGDLKDVIEVMLNYLKEQEDMPMIFQITPEKQQLIENLFPNRFLFYPLRERFEYIYLTERLSTLFGRKLQSKRNNINYLTKVYNWIYEPITAANIDECKAMESLWNHALDIKIGDTLEMENRALSICFEHFNELDIAGGLIRLNGEVSAISFGCRLNSDTYLLLFEKAKQDIRGAYSVMNQQFVLHNAMPYAYVNREEDCGNEGLRMAKMQYHPDILQEILYAKEK